MRKISAHLIFDGYQFQRNKILVFDEKNVLIDILDYPNNKELEAIEFYNGILCPGFVNTHTHLELSFLKNKLQPKKKLSGFIQQIKQVDRTYDAEKFEQIIVADRMMYNEGISVCADIANSSITSEIKEKSNIYYYTFVELYSPNDDEADFLYNKGLKQLQNFQNAAITPHSTYSVSFTLLKNIINNIKESDIISIHYKESLLENELFRSFQPLYNFVDNPSHYFISKLPQKNKILFVHNTFIDELELDFILNTFEEAYFVVCPNSNLFIENALPPENLFNKAINRICIGTDSLASNTQLSIIEEIKTLSKHYSKITLEKWLSLATIQGAKALNLDTVFGSFEKQKKPGVVLIENVDLFNLCINDETYCRRIL